MATTSLNISLSESAKAYVDATVENGAYPTPSAYIDSLVSEDRARYMHGLEASLLKALQEEPIEATEDEWASGNILAILQQKLADRERAEVR